jgi:amino acid transporter
MLKRIRERLVGGPRNLLDPNLQHQLALIAFFAWVGLGSDGLSSSAYGPEAAYRALGSHTHLALYLTVAMVGTVFLISASYSQIIELFPSGGGGYLVATRLLSPALGLVSGCALVIDYMLTVATSVASGCDAIFSLLPPGVAGAKLGCEFVVIAGLTIVNLRGVRESVATLIPIFVAFIVTHAALIVWGIVSHGAGLPHLVGDTVLDTRGALSQLGTVGVAIVFLRAFSLGGGTFTGIEAVSNAVQVLREPRVQTAKRTMLYMATSLALTAGGILLCYLLNRVAPEPGKTLNATLWEGITRGWVVGGFDLGRVIVWVTLVSEGALLFVAAQTGFIDGPRTLSVMAIDRWVPTRFAYLSERLVTQNGVLLMSLATVALLYYTRGRVDLLIVMYSINVFITFTLSQCGMARHWWQVRKTEQHWRRRLVLAVSGSIVTAGILAVTATVKFSEGGWVTLLVTAIFAGICVLVRRHYNQVRGLLTGLDSALMDLSLAEPAREPELAPDGPTAILCVSGFDGLGVHTLLSLQRLLPRHYRNLVFVSAGVVDSGQFKGADSMHALEAKLKSDLERYVGMARRMGYYAEYRYSLGTDPIEEIESLCVDLSREFRGVTVFAGQLVFQRENFFTRSLHQETAFAIQRRLQFRGLAVVILPIRVWEPTRKSGSRFA